MKPVPAAGDAPVLPAWDGACLANVVPALLEYPPLGEGWIPDEALAAEQVVVLLVDGLGWNQLAERPELAPLLHSSHGGPITSVAPSTTAAALTSFTTGSSPGEHGLIGYRVRVGGESLNTLRWTTGAGDARERIRPSDLVHRPAFNNRQPVVITKADFVRSGFTAAHLAGTDFRGYGVVSTLVFEVARAAAEGARFVYAYYDGLDRVGHERGHGGEFDAEMAFVDRLIGQVRQALDDSVALLVTADHGQVHTGKDVIELAPAVSEHVMASSGEARMLWLHARPGHERQLLEAASAEHSDRAWVRARSDAIDEGWFGPVSPQVRDLFGDVVLASRDRSAFVEPDFPTTSLIGRHGSLTADEMYVPLLSVPAVASS